jgi:hypothetical protein
MPRAILIPILLASLTLPTAGTAQLASRNPDSTSQTTIPPRRTRLILKDGTYQLVLSYKVVGNRVQFLSAERNDEPEEIPLDLVDLEATRKWEKLHTTTLDADGIPQRAAPVLDPELAKEEASRAALTAEVAPDLRLVPEDMVLALDTFRGTPELVPLTQTDGDLNRQTGHSILAAVLNPYSSRHQVLELKGEKAAVQLHVPDPAFYIRLDDEQRPSGEVLTVDTHGASTAPAIKEKNKDDNPSNSRYAIIRVDVRQDVRIVASFTLIPDNATRREQDLIPTTATPLPGNHWLKLVPSERLLFGEYCIIEILNDHQINLAAWDFGVHPTAPENRDVILPKPRKSTLNHRTPDPDP